MTPTKAQEWIDALEGPYADRKGRRHLCAAEGMCCLGVLVDMHGAWDDGRTPNNLYQYGYAESGNSSVFPADEFLTSMGIDVGTSDIAAKDGVGESTGSRRLAYINDTSETFAPVIAEIRKMFIEGKEV